MTGEDSISEITGRRERTGGGSARNSYVASPREHTPEAVFSALGDSGEICGIRLSIRPSRRYALRNSRGLRICNRDSVISVSEQMNEHV